MLSGPASFRLSGTVPFGARRVASNPKNSSESTAYYFGTFNPIHNGHIALAEAAASQYGYDKVLFVPVYSAPHKDPSQVASFNDRVAMIRKAIADKPSLGVSVVERSLKTPSYTARTVDHLMKTDPRPKLPFICGLDVIRDLPHWKDPLKLVEKLRFLVAPRGRSYIPKGVKVGGAWHRLDRDRLDLSGIPAATRRLSSTAVREAVAHGDPLTGMVPPAVEAFIRARGLYRPQFGEKIA